MRRYRYHVYGLTIESEIQCPELPFDVGEPDVVIRRASLRQMRILPNPSRSNIIYAGEKTLIDHKHARYLISNGNEIIVDPVDNAPKETVRLYLLGSALGAILHQRGLLAIHGNGVVVDGECIIFAGHSGSGKSTLSAAFAQRGFLVLSDDVCVLDISDEEPPLVYPGIPQIKLWADAAAGLDINLENRRRVCPEEEKFVLPISEIPDHKAYPLKGIYILHYQQDQGICFKALRAIDKITALKNHTYRQRIVRKSNMTGPHFALCAKLAARTPVTKILRPKDYRSLNPLINTFLS